MYLDKIIWKFTSNREIHGDRLKEPVRDGDNIVATDGKVLVVAPVSRFNEPYKFKELTTKFPDYQRMIKEHDKNQWVHQTERGKLLEACNNMPVEDIYINCAHCEGVGKLYTKKGNERKCDECDSEGHSEYNGTMIRIPDNDDSEKVTSHLLRVNGACFDPNILKNIAEIARELDDDVKWVTLVPQNTCMLYIRDVLVVVMPFYLNVREYEGVVNVVEV